jgi:hypothetical protein
MSRTSQILDRQPGALPEIRTTVDHITFHMAVAGVPKEHQLIIRCGAKGDIWISIQSTRT